MPIHEAEVQVLPGPKTRMWTYNGSFPGPTIRRPAGHRTEVTFHHRLPPGAGELSVHLHGGHNRTQFDGQPGGLTKSHPKSFFCDIPQGLSLEESGNDFLLYPGKSKTYVYDLHEDGRPERAAFQWYHDHRLDHTARNVWHGLAGMWIIDDDLDRSLPLPSGERDVPLMIAERTFDRDNQLTDPFTDLRPPADGITGHTVLVNGAFMPHHRVTPQRHRLRVLNASQFRAYNLHLSNGMPMTQIGTDSGLMPRPVRRSSVLIGPAERVELIVDFSGAAGDSVELRSGPHRHGRTVTGLKPYVGALMQFRVGSGRMADRTKVPHRLRPLPAWTKHVSKNPTTDGRSKSAATSRRSGSSTAAASTRPGPTPSRRSTAPSPGKWPTRPRWPTSSTCTTQTGTSSPAMASRPHHGKTASRRPSSSSPTNGS